MGELLDVCELLCTPETSAVVVLRYPRHWKCRKIGKGRLLFTRFSEADVCMAAIRGTAGFPWDPHEGVQW